ncbi:MAG: helix-turn-helix domain-containing protein, partial [bacterium]
VANSPPSNLPSRWRWISASGSARDSASSGRRGWTQVELAEKLGLDRSYLADVERGKRNISMVNLEVIAQGFGISPSRLFVRL